MRKKKRGFTLIEMLVAMAILVIAFGLVTFLYTKAARIRKIVVTNSEVQQVLSSITNTITYGDKSHWGMVHATGLDDSQYSETTICYLKNGSETMTVRIDAGEVFVEYDSSGEISLDPGDKVEILTDAPYNSRFEYFNPSGAPASSADEVSFIKIVLWARSTDPVMRFSPPTPIVTGVKLRGKTSF